MTEQRALPVAEVRVTLHSLADGEAEVAIAIDPEGDLRGAYGDEEARFQALQTLFEVVQRELADALDTLASGDEPDDEEPNPSLDGVTPS
jgi:hypothetical protein